MANRGRTVWVPVIVQKCRLSYFRHVAAEDEDQWITMNKPPKDWRRQCSRPRTIWTWVVEEYPTTLKFGFCRAWGEAKDGMSSTQLRMECQLSITPSTQLNSAEFSTRRGILCCINWLVFLLLSLIFFLPFMHCYLWSMDIYLALIKDYLLSGQDITSLWLSFAFGVSHFNSGVKSHMNIHQMLCSFWCGDDFFRWFFASIWLHYVVLWCSFL